jgi:Zn-dependent peptidase ImmA (M78 family)
MITRARRLALQKLARSTLKDNGILQLPVSPKQLATALDIAVVPLPFQKPDISGCLMLTGSTFGIGFSTAIKSLGFQNFTVGHELGHYFIDGHVEALLGSGRHFSQSGFISNDFYEMEADAFASELLMPWSLIENIIKSKASGFESIKNISESCESSLVASAIRLCQDTKETVAAIVSFNGKIEFMTASESFRSIRGLQWLRRGDPLPSGVPSAQFGLQPNWINECNISEEGGKLRSWFGGVPDLDVEEDVVGLGSYGRLLTVLVTEWDEDDEESPDKDEWAERWEKGIFRPRK